MMKIRGLLFTTICIIFSGFVVAGRVDISLDPTDWIDNGSVSGARTLTQTGQGYLRATCNTYRGSIHYRTKDSYNLQGAVVRYQWRVNCGDNYCWTYDGCSPWGRMSSQALTTHHSWASSIVISTNIWIYTEVRFNIDRTWSANYSYNGYGQGGINTNSGTITESNWDLLANSFVHKMVGDGYANSFYYEIAELYYETPGPDIEIVNPADGAAFSPNELISFEATASGGAEPYAFDWESDVDGVLGSGQTLAADTLSEGVHTITVTCTDDAGQNSSKSITVYILNPPVIDPIANHTITDSASYNGPVPMLTQGNTAVTWSLADGPAGMTIAPDTGQVFWAVPITSGSPYTVTIRAENPKGSDQVSWQLEVIEAPSFATQLWANITDGGGGNNGHDHFNRTVIDLEGNVLVAGYIDSISGQAAAAYLAKYSPEGQLIWSKALDAPAYSGKAEYNDRFYDIAVDSENNVVVVGSKSGNWTGYSLGSYHNAWWVQKYSPDGQTLLWEILWQDTYSSAWQSALGVHIDAQDNVYVAGSSFGGWGSGPQHQWVIYKYNKDGQVLLGPIKVNFVNYIYLQDYAYDVTVDAAGDIYAVGIRGVSGTEGGIYNNLDWHVRKFSGMTGATIWQDTYSGPANLLDYATGAVLDSQGNLLVTGYTNKGTNNSTNINYDWLMIKYDGATGARLWMQTYESRPGASEACYKAVVDNNDDFYVCGNVNPAGVLQRRIAKISGIDGATLAEAIWQSDNNGSLTGLACKDDLLAVSGSLANALNNDGFVSLLTVDIGVRILSPGYYDWFEFGAPITFSAEPVGSVEPPYYYRWSSDIDGQLGMGHTLEISGLLPGEHLITCWLDYGDDETMHSSVRIIVALPPQITPPDDVIIGEGQAYTSPEPLLNEAAHSADWTLIEAPEGMTIDSQTGRVSWPNPVGSAEPYTIIIQAENPLGSNQAGWLLTVLSLPQIQTPPTQIAVESTPFTSDVPMLVKGTPPIEWSLLSGPSSMTIDPDSGVVSWANPEPSFSAYTIAIRASNAVGSDTASFSLLVYSSPSIAEITDKTLTAGQPFSMNPTLVKGVPQVQWTLEAAPETMQIHPETGTLTWPNAALKAGVYQVAVRATNSMGTHTQSFTISVLLPPVLGAMDDETIHEGQSYTKTITLLQGTAPLQFSLISKPAGMTFDLANGQLTLPYANGNYSPYTVTVRVSNAVGTDQKSFVLTVLQAPQIRPIAPAMTAENAPFAAAAPQLYKGSAPITWSLADGPAGMTIDPLIGIVSWPSPTYAGSPHRVTIKAQNVVGTHTQSWSITVIQPPVIAAYGDQIAGNAISYLAPLPTLTQGTHVTWSLAHAPAGMTIQPSTGQIVWPSPVASEVPHMVTLRAENLAGSDTESFALTIHSKPVLAEVSDIVMTENKPYVGSKAELLAGQAPVTFSLTQSPAGMTVDAATGAMSWPTPTAVGSPHGVRLHAANAYGADEKTFKAVVPIGYAAEAWTDIELAPAGSPIPIVGQAYDLTDGSPSTHVTVHVQIRLKNTVRVYKPVTNEQGEFSFDFVPVGNEAGFYDISAGHPLAVPQEAQDSFTLVALAASDTLRRPKLTEGQWFETLVALKNLGDTTLTNIDAVKVGGAETIDIDFEPLAHLSGNVAQTVTLRLRAVDASVAQTVIGIQFNSDQGAAASLSYTAQVVPLTAEVSLFPTMLEAGMIRGEQQTVTFDVLNKGGKATAPLSVLLPDAPWLAMTNPVVIGSLEPGQSKAITLLLKPDPSLALGPYQGTIYVHGDQVSQALPFTFHCVSNRFGNLAIKAVDEYTYFAQDAPLVQGAHLTLRDAYTGDVLRINEPMPQGTMLLEDIVEGYYILDLAAPEHSDYRATIYVQPGITGQITAFLSRQLVRYEWTVTPTEIQDVYTVTLNTTFETNVPAPVVVVDPANVDLSAMVDGRMQVDFTVTNHGLIAAEEFYLAFNDHPRYQVDLLTEFKGCIDPGQTIVIPAMITDTTVGTVSMMSEMKPQDSPLSPFLGSCDPVRGGGYYTYVCGKDGKWKKTPVTLANWACDLANIVLAISGSDEEDRYDEGHDYQDDYIPPWDPAPTQPSTPLLQTVINPTPLPGKPNPPRTAGDSPKAPFVSRPTITVTGTGKGTCDPCPRLMMEAALECAWSLTPTGCVTSLFKGAFDCIRSCWGEDFGSETCVIGCYSGLVGVITSCGKDLTPVGVAYNIIMCGYSLYTACDTQDAAAYQAARNELATLRGIAVPQEMPSTSEALEPFMEQLDRLETIVDAMNYTLGDTLWFSGIEGEQMLLAEWLGAYQDAISPAGDGGTSITDAELQSLASRPRPSQIGPGDVEAVCQRWNRTMAYWQLGKFTTTDLQPGDNPDFIAMDVLLAKSQAANDAILANEAQGYTTLFDGLDDTFELFKETVSEQSEGVCAKVQMQIQQSATLTRVGFNASLQMQNLSGVDAIENIAVDIKITDRDGNDATDLFGLYPPVVMGLSNIEGQGRLDPGAAFDAQWLLVPSLDAAPQDATHYFVGGSIHYTINGGAVTIPIIPDTITVKPDAQLHLKYFLQRDVYGDDPFTEEVVEPSVPFVLGLMVSNTGAGSAYNMTLQSAQPTIIRQEADKQILLDFELLDTQVDDQKHVPSLEVALGHIAPNQTKTALWWMRSSLQGEFIDYDAVFAHTDTLGDPRLSLIQSVSIHELVHAVWAGHSEEDTLPDFLTNDVPDADGLPDRLHRSDGTVEPVAAYAGTAAWLSGTPEAGQVTLTIPQTPNGFFYVRLDNPGWLDYELARVARSDGTVLPAHNYWTTYKRYYPDDSPAYDKALMHLFDEQPTGSYTLYYEPPANKPPVVSRIDVAGMMELSSAPLVLRVIYNDLTGIDPATLGDNNIGVIDSYGIPLTVCYREIIDAGMQTTVLYEILPPNGLWESSLNGLYTVLLRAEQVADPEGLFADSAVLGGFVVSIHECVKIEFDQAVLVDQRRLTQTTYELDYRIVVHNQCDTPIRNLRLIPLAAPAHFEVLAHDVRFCLIPAQSQAASEGVLTVRIDYDNPPDLSGRFTWQSMVFHPADVTRNGIVDISDLTAFTDAWLSGNPCFDWVPLPYGDGRVDLADFSRLAEHWLQTGP
jgi:hypothetical protein